MRDLKSRRGGGMPRRYETHVFIARTRFYAMISFENWLYYRVIFIYAKIGGKYKFVIELYLNLLNIILWKHFRELITFEKTFKILFQMVDW